MRRKRTAPWIHRWSRPLMAGIAMVGAVVTAYLTVVKLTGNASACPTKGCDIVLSSPYATVLGLPLALFGLIAYGTMALLALAPLSANPKTEPQRYNQIQDWTWPLLFAGGTAMLVFSLYLMYLLAFEIQAVCVYCVASALLSASLFVLALIGRDWRDRGQLIFTGVVVAILVIVGTMGVYANINTPAAERSGPGETGLAITTPSGPAEIALAAHLKQVGAKMYGAYWCPHCHDQKQLFGKEAFRQINYIECDPQGQNPQPELCQAAGVQGYPTWEVNGKMVTGTQPLQQLAILSNYQGSRNFQNSLSPAP